MEFFEKAHIAKTKDCSQKETKSGEKRKQLKRKPRTYKHSDNVLINESEGLNDFESSSSVSGVSDLDCSNSTFEGEKQQNLTNCDHKDESPSNSNNLGSRGIHPSEVKVKDKIKRESCRELNPNDKSISNERKDDQGSVEFLSDYDDEIAALSGEDDPTQYPRSALSSMFTYPSEASSKCVTPEEFDPDGSLAQKIHVVLDYNDLNQGTKRKIEETNLRNKKSVKVRDKCCKRSGNTWPHRSNKALNNDIEMNSLEAGLAKVKLPGKLFTDLYFTSESYSSNSTDISETLSTDDDEMEVSDDPTPFVSILAENVPSQSLSDVLGEYCHPTIKNVPFESQTINSTDNSGIFMTEETNITDLVEPGDEIGSLIPEIDNTEMVDDIDIPTDLDISTQNLNEESVVYNEILQSEDISEKEVSLESMDSIIINPIKVYCGKKSCVLVMKHPAHIYVHGKLKVKPLGGTVEVFGYILQEKTYDIYAPHYDFAQSVKTVENVNAFYGLFGKLTANGLSVADAEEVVTSIGEYDAVMNLQPLTSKKIEFVQTHFNVTDLFGKQNKNVDDCLKNASDLLGCSLYLSKPSKNLQEPASWKQVTRHGLADQFSKGIICGGKGAGKSTFLRYYVNKLLAQGPVLVIDLDPGQCEFTVAGNVSATVVTEPLLGPNFTHLAMPELSLHLAMINTMDHPRRYVNAVEMLIHHCYSDERLKTMPWIVNTMGMTNALGLKFISHTVLKVKPTFLLQIDSKTEKKRYDFHLYPQTVRNLYFEDFQNDPIFKNITEVEVDYKFFISHHTEQSPKNNLWLAPRDGRYLNYLAYFGEMLEGNARNLLDIIPYEVDLKEITLVLNVQLSEDLASAVWNGKVVSLCCSDQQAAVSTMTDKPLQWYGCGLIRGRDVEKRNVYIITPTSDAQLSNVNTVAYSDWVPELRGLERALPPDTQVPYRTASHYHHRQFVFAPKRRYNPVQILKMSRNS